MQWIEENSKDAQMLTRIELSPLDVGHAEGNERLVKGVRRHNKALTDLAQRFDQLAKDREKVARADHWFDEDSNAVQTERRRVIAESWDVLVTLRKLIQDRKVILRELEDRFSGKIEEMHESYGKAFDKARKTLAREHRDYIKAEPVHGLGYVDGLAEVDPQVVELRDQETELRGVLDSLQTHYYRAGQDSALTFRQYEVYEQLI